MIIYGKNTVLEALRVKRKINKLYLTTNTIEIVKKNFPSLKLNIEIKTLKEMDKIANGNHQGFICEIIDYQYQDLDEFLKKNLAVCSLAILDNLEDPHNLGAILRSADAAGIDGIIIPKNRSVSLNDTVAKVSTGAIEHVPCFQVTNLVQTMEKLKKHGFWIAGLDMAGSVSYTDYDYSGKVAIVVGNEGKGISRLVKDNCDTLIKIPMVGHVDSLNASVSCSIIFFEILRKRG